MRCSWTCPSSVAMGMLSGDQGRSKRENYPEAFERGVGKCCEKRAADMSARGFLGFRLLQNLRIPSDVV
jgi:hypothetical protein